MMCAELPVLRIVSENEYRLVDLFNRNIIFQEDVVDLDTQ